MNKHEETIRVLRNEYRFALAQQRDSVRGLLNGRLSRSGKTRTRLTNKTKRKEKTMEKRFEEVCEVIDHMEPEQYMGLIHDVMGKLLSDREFAIGVIATALLGDRLDSKLHVRTDTDD